MDSMINPAGVDQGTDGILAEMQAVYQERLHDDSVVGSPRNENIVSIVNNYGENTGFPYNGKLAIGVLIVAEFDESDGTTCVPWLIPPWFAAVDHKQGQHNFAINDFAAQYGDRIVPDDRIADKDGDVDWWSSDLVQKGYFIPDPGSGKVSVYLDHHGDRRVGQVTFDHVREFTSDGMHQVYAKSPSADDQEGLTTSGYVVLAEGQEFETPTHDMNSSFAFSAEPGDFVGAVRQMTELDGYVEKHGLDGRQAELLADIARENFENGVQQPYDDICVEVIEGTRHW